jgi:NNP family nitrate/nitrite transporter-like MFS transporter
LFLTILSFVSSSLFFIIIASVALGVLVAVQFIDEPKGHMAEVQEDGSVEMIEVG